MAKRAPKPVLSYRVFLSHSHQDRWISAILKEKISQKGVKVWLDAFDLPGGANIRERIKGGMRKCNECLILLSPASRGSDWVKYEAALADAEDKWITFLLLHAVDDDVPKPFHELACMSINDFESYLTQLVARSRGDSELP